MAPADAHDPERLIDAASLRETFAALRVVSDAAVTPVQRSLGRHGQLCAVTAWRDADEALEVVDGFKRLRAARALGWTRLRVRVLDADAADATVAVATLNAVQGLTELEEAWLCRALYRVHRLTQPEIGARLGRHKSWVCRRLTLAEGLHEQLQIDVRLGLLAPRAACELARLPHGNQPAASVAAQRRGMTVAQVARMVQTALALPDAATRAQWLAELAEGRAPVLRAAPAPRLKSEVELLLGDVDAATRVAARLQARLRDKPLGRLEAPHGAHLTEALSALDPVLAQLRGSIGRVLTGRDLRDAAME
jgi:ParB-like chromosome segregation protein Spo0J